MFRELGDAARVGAWYRLRRFTRRSRNAEARKAFEAALSNLRPGDICIDCGANVGAITARLADTGATVHAFEPDPRAFKVLTGSVGSRSNVVLHNAALGVGSGTIRLYMVPQSDARCVSVSQGSSTIPAKVNVSPDSFVDVPKIDFVEFVRSLEKPVSLVKMDIEGAEVSILKSVIEHRLNERIGQMFVETHEKQIPELRGETMAVIGASRKLGNINCDWW